MSCWVVVMCHMMIWNCGARVDVLCIKQARCSCGGHLQLASDDLKRPIGVSYPVHRFTAVRSCLSCLTVCLCFVVCFYPPALLCIVRDIH